MKTDRTKLRNKIQRMSFIILVSLFMYNSVFAVATVNYETVANGYWTSASTWKNGMVPGSTVNAGNTITIKHNVNMNINVNLNCDMYIESGASLINTSNKLFVNSAFLSNEGIFQIKNLDNNSGKIYNSGTFQVISATSNNAGYILSEGDISLGKFFNNSGELYAKGKITFSGSSQNNGSGKIEIYGDVVIGTSFALNDKSYMLIDGKSSIGSGIQLNSGEFILNGISNFGGTLTINGAAFTNYAEVNVVSTFTFNSGTLLNYGSMTFNIASYLYNNASIVTYGNIYFKKTLTNYSKNISVETTDTSTGNFVVAGSVTGEKEVVVKRHITHSGWHYVSSPVSNAKSDVFMGAALYSYDETKASWVAHRAGETLEPGKGYDVYFKNKNQVVTFSGTMNSGTISRNLTRTINAGWGYNLVGNPYPSAINWDATSGWTKTNVSNAVYVWDMKSNNIAAYVNGVGTNGGSNIIPATSAFFVLCTSTSGGKLQMTDAVKVNAKPNFREAAPSNIMRVKLSNGVRFDETVIRFDEEASTKFDYDFDAEKMYSFDAATPQIYSFSAENLDLAISTLNMASEPVSVKLGYIANAEGNFSLSFNFENFDLNVNVYLEDTELGKIHDLQTGDYLFNTVTGENNSRFILHFVPLQVISNNNDQNMPNNNMTSVTEQENKNSNLVYAASKKIYVQTNAENTKVSIYNVAGQEIISETFSGAELHSIDMHNNNGIFIVKTMSGELINSVKVIVE